MVSCGRRAHYRASEPSCAGFVVAHTLPELTPSIRVLKKCGFVLVGDGPVEDGMRTIRYEVTPGQFRPLA
jgi:RimJ/RimL family protein N-acetyltransferase